MSLTIGVIGLGLIGGSLAKAIRRVHPDYYIVGYNRSEEARVLSLREGTCNVVTDQVDEHFSHCDYIFLCTPVEHNETYLQTLKDIISDDCIISDVGSVKTNIHEAVAALHMNRNFIGGHPMAGSEKTGYKNTNDRLFENAFYIITPNPENSKDAVDQLVSIVESISAIPVVIDYKEHDRVVAAISHLPHLIAAALVNLVKDSDSDKGYMKMIAAGGFKDITRIASSSPDMWEQICMTNTDNIIAFIDKYTESLQKIKQSLLDRDGSAIYRLFEKSRDYRNSFNNTANGIIAKEHRIYCDIIDESGSIAHIADILARNNISIKNIGIIHNREFEEGVLKVAFYNDSSKEQAAKLLAENGYTVHA